MRWISNLAVGLKDRKQRSALHIFNAHTYKSIFLNIKAIYLHILAFQQKPQQREKNKAQLKLMCVLMQSRTTRNLVFPNK